MTALLAVAKSWCFTGRGRTGACQTHSTKGNRDGFCLQLICYLAVQLPLPYGVAWYITTHMRLCALLLPKVICRLRKHTPRGLITLPFSSQKDAWKQWGRKVELQGRLAIWWLKEILARKEYDQTLKEESSVCPMQSRIEWKLGRYVCNTLRRKIPQILWKQDQTQMPLLVHNIEHTITHSQMRTARCSGQICWLCIRDADWTWIFRFLQEMCLPYQRTGLQVQMWHRRGESTFSLYCSIFSTKLSECSQRSTFSFVKCLSVLLPSGDILQGSDENEPRLVTTKPRYYIPVKHTLNNCKNQPTNNKTQSTLYLPSPRLQPLASSHTELRWLRTGTRSYWLNGLKLHFTRDSIPEATFTSLTF